MIEAPKKLGGNGDDDPLFRLAIWKRVRPVEFQNWKRHLQDTELADRLISDPEAKSAIKFIEREILNQKPFKDKLLSLFSRPLVYGFAGGGLGALAATSLNNSQSTTMAVTGLCLSMGLFLGMGVNERIDRQKKLSNS